MTIYAALDNSNNLIELDYINNFNYIRLGLSMEGEDKKKVMFIGSNQQFLNLALAIIKSLQLDRD